MVKNKNRLGFEAQLSRHPHHMPAAYSASLSTGMIIPQWFDIAQAGDTYKMHPKMFARLQNVQTAFLGEVDINIKFFFVPLQMLYTPFGQIFAQTNDVISSMFKDLGTIDTFPMVAGDTLVESVPQAGFYFGHKECAGKELARLLDAFDLNPYAALLRRDDLPEDYEPEFNPTATPIDVSQCHLPNFSPWLLAAYQAVYQKKFRNDEYEKFNIAAFNVDQYWNNTPITSNYDLIKLRYAQRPSDYFTKTRVAPILSSINKLAANSQSDSDNVGNSYGGYFDTLLNKINSWLGTEYNYIRNSDYQQDFSDTEGSLQGVDSGDQRASNKLGSPSAAGGSTAVANIRAAFALDKFLRVYGRAGKTYDEQILAHFGVKIPHDVKHDLSEIAHFHGKLQADPIYATATIGQDNASVLGQVGGQGQVTLEAEKEIKFTAPVHGVMLAVAYALTKPRYYGTFSKLNLLGSRIDFPIPEFDKLGAQPVYAFECNPQNLVYEGATEGTLISQRFGWQNRWQQFKESYNRCSFLYAPADAFGEEQGAEYVTENAFMPWLLSRPAFYNLNDPDASLRAVDLWESPNALNTVMDVVYDGNWSNDYFYAPHLMLQTDPILTDFYNDVTKVSWMSPTGEPDL